MKNLALAVLAVMIATPASAAFVGKRQVVVINDEAATLVDLSTIKRTGNTVRFWWASVYKEPREGIDYERYLDEVNCSTDQMRVLMSAAYKVGGTLVTSGTNPSKEWRYIIPDTVGARLAAVACGTYPKDVVKITTEADYDGVVENLRSGNMEQVAVALESIKPEPKPKPKKAH